MDEAQITRELSFKAVRSSGSGGQHVNKTSSKVELYFNVETSKGLLEEEKLRLQKKLASRLTKDHLLILHSEESRSQHKNKIIVIEKFFDLLRENIKKPKARKKTKPGKAAKLKRLKAKKINAEKKARRGDPLK
ncbi:MULTISPECIES: alternative ribosome rescue aminoacyl-tRNA hydrolase ArfB [Salegentibacter]|uniref:Aminoacyl-tRNA hydrolase n=1 Tax=Salegentibacter maritimus TaxID=2794347 RepID=A0ABS0TE71_9FLAO|nr:MULTISPECIES: alternative ribosome rescue aminoacyl-tRNA hydrolase ArfB [Salegentibacter]MBE7640775.1 aminoacyl-tRNA hydrolase [Salegentibacter sp. BLCTC]MBI6117158.1 aminoacyl-tRNA hydrolase [Salegentibacter maritimus]MBI6119303.1 aminoacyl-tRNA hydrolase [Salegentibacter maritimus]